MNQYWQCHDVEHFLHLTNLKNSIFKNMERPTNGIIRIIESSIEVEIGRSVSNKCMIQTSIQLKDLFWFWTSFLIMVIFSTSARHSKLLILYLGEPGYCSLLFMKNINFKRFTPDSATSVRTFTAPCLPVFTFQFWKIFENSSGRCAPWW